MPCLSSLVHVHCPCPNGKSNQLNFITLLRFFGTHIPCHSTKMNAVCWVFNSIKFSCLCVCVSNRQCRLCKYNITVFCCVVLIGDRQQQERKNQHQHQFPRNMKLKHQMTARKFVCVQCALSMHLSQHTVWNCQRCFFVFVVVVVVFFFNFILFHSPAFAHACCSNAYCKIVEISKYLVLS